MANLQAQKLQLEQTISTLKGQKEQVVAGILQIENGINTINTKLQEGKAKLEQAKIEIEKQETELNQAKQTANKEFQSAQKTINSSKNEIEHPTWYILDRNSNTGYNGFMQDTKSIENLGKVFPIVFFVIATLISLTSMTRMVEEQRVQIGTMKALGYNKIQIASKYLLYASLACIIGGAIGMLIGCASLPRIIWMMYSMMYEIPNFVAAFNLYYAALGLGLASICIIGATLYTATNVLGETPSELMRPKAPKPGKRVLL